MSGKIRSFGMKRKLKYLKQWSIIVVYDHGEYGFQIGTIGLIYSFKKPYVVVAEV